MTSDSHIQILEQGVTPWNRWRAGNRAVQPDLTGADLAGRNLQRINLREADMRGALLGGADLKWADLDGAILSGGDAGPADMSNCWLTWAHMNGAYLREVDLSRAHIGSVKLKRANLSKANLIDADLQCIEAQWADFGGAQLANAKLIDANLHKANLSDCDFTNADLQRANLSQATLYRAILAHAILCGSLLEGTDIRRSTLDGADFSGCTFGWTSLNDLDLSTAEHLDQTIHFGPSSLGIDTLYRSGGKIPERFLIDIGLPEDFLAYAQALVTKAVELYSCFISYASTDHAFVERLHVDLQARGVRCWYAPDDMKIGDPIRARINESIKLHDKLLLVLSTHSLASAWVADEVEAALEKERRTGKTVLFPITLDDAVWDSNEAWANKVRQRKIGDFRQWKDHDTYFQTFERLLRDLKPKE